MRYEYGVFTTIRAEMGQSISGACGQLALMSQPGKSATLKDLEDTDPPSFQQIASSSKTLRNVREATHCELFFKSLDEHSLAFGTLMVLGGILIFARLFEQYHETIAEILVH
eukprot:Filipodium_phascolosomae@DN6134_c0_g1_i1.p1